MLLRLPVLPSAVPLDHCSVLTVTHGTNTMPGVPVPVEIRLDIAESHKMALLSMQACIENLPFR